MSRHGSLTHEGARVLIADLAGNVQSLQSLRGSFVLLNSGRPHAPLALDLLNFFIATKRRWPQAHLQILAVSVSEASGLQEARTFAAQEALSFPVVFATGGNGRIYNIIYRHLFDRRRDLGIPTSFLLDREGILVKVYQGPIDPQRLIEDVRLIPRMQPIE